jgi:flagellar protein FliO/FliZ
MGSLFTIGLIVAILAAAALGLYLYTRSNSENPLFAPRERRLAYVERAHLDGGRKLVLIRRDDVEHLLLVGGPIDLVIETGIPAEQPGREPAGTTGDVFGAVQSYADSARTWQRGFGLTGGRSGAVSEPGLSLAKGGEPNGEDTLELTTAHEAKR